MAASRELRALLNNRRTIAALEAHVQRVLDKIKAKLVRRISQPGLARVQSLLVELNALTAQLGPGRKGFVGKWIKRNITKSMVLGDDAATRQLREQFLKALADPSGIRQAWTIQNQTGLRSISAAMEATMRGASESIRRVLGTAIRTTQRTLWQNQAIRDATVKGIIQGATGKQVADDMASILLKGKVSPQVRKRLAELGFRADMFKEFEAIARGQLVTVGKVRMNVRDYSRLVARTQMREAHTVGTIARLQQNSVDHTQISQHVQDEPDECTPWAGNVYYIGEGTDPAGFPRLDSVVGGGPPFHPNCEHVLLPYVVAFKTDAAIQKDLDATKALPKRFFGKGAKDVRKLVKGVPRADLRKMAPRGAGDIKKKVA